MPITLACAISGDLSDTVTIFPQCMKLQQFTQILNVENY